MIKEFFIAATTGSLNTIYSIAVIVIPLMIFIEFAKTYALLDKISHLMTPLVRFLKVKKSASFALAVGVFLGISYGAGLLIQSSQDGTVDRKSLTIASFFLAGCHAIIEDTLIFVAIGAVGWILLSFRFILSLLTTYFIAQYIQKNQ